MWVCRCFVVVISIYLSSLPLAWKTQSNKEKHCHLFIHQPNNLIGWSQSQRWSQTGETSHAVWDSIPNWARIELWQAFCKLTSLWLQGLCVKVLSPCEIATLLVLPCLFWRHLKVAVCLNLCVQGMERERRVFLEDARKELQLDWGAEERFIFRFNLFFTCTKLDGW